jgi:hypothetical protein
MSGLKTSIRKALEAPLLASVTLYGPYVKNTTVPSVEWPKLALKREVGFPYLRFSFFPGVDQVLEMGQHPLTVRRGYASIGIFTPLGEGEDKNDTLSDQVVAAYPYGTELVFGGRKVIIDTVDPGSCVPDEGWLFSPVNVNWTLWRNL